MKAKLDSIQSKLSILNSKNVVTDSSDIQDKSFQKADVPKSPYSSRYRGNLKRSNPVTWATTPETMLQSPPPNFYFSDEGKWKCLDIITSPDKLCVEEDDNCLNILTTSKLAMKTQLDLQFKTEGCKTPHHAPYESWTSNNFAQSGTKLLITGNLPTKFQLHGCY